MKNLGLVLIFSLLAAIARAQSPYFIYFETDDARPFYVKMEDRIYSSSDIGYFILPNLADSSYILSIGFPSTPDILRFDVPLRGGDRGFSIRQEASGTILYDLESEAIIRAKEENWKNKLNYQYRNDEFTALLARASNDTSLFYVPIYSSNPVAVKPGVVPVPQPVGDTGTRAETLAIDTTVSTKPLVVEVNNPAVDLPDSTALVTKEVSNAGSDTASLATTSSSDTLLLQSTHLVRSDSIQAPPAGVQADTALVTSSAGTIAQVDTIFNQVSDTAKISTPQVSGAEVRTAEVYKRSNVKKHSESSISEGFGLVFFDSHGEGIDTIRIIIPNPRVRIADADTVAFAEGMIERPEPVKQQVAKPALTPCREVASDKDFFKLRRNMAGRNSEQDMLEEAGNSFRSRCFSAQHIKNLSTLFLTDSSKYLFFELAYGHVTDRENFPFLSAELKDTTYQNKFKSLIEQ